MEVKTDSRVKALIKLAQKRYPNRAVRVQPVTNKQLAEVYQVHTRPKSIATLADSAWNLVSEGTLSQLLAYMKKEH